MTDVRLTALNPADSQVYPVACNDKGELLLEANQASGNLDVQGDLTVTGTASFVNNAAEIQGQGFFVGTGFVSYKMAASSYAIHDDDVNWKYSVYYDGTTHIGGYITTVDPANDSPNIALKADGSATFAGSVQQSGYASNYGCNLYTDGINQGGLFAKATSANGLLPAQGTAFNALWDGSDVARIRYDGSATFAGQVTCGSPTTNGYGAIINSSSIFTGSGSVATLYVRNHDSTGRAIYCAKYNDQFTSIFEVLADGSGKFAGSITAANITFKLAPEVVSAMPTPLIDEGFASQGEIDLLRELIKMKAEIRDLNAFMQKSVQESSEIEQ